MKDDVIYRQDAIDGMRKLQRWNVVRGYNKNEGFLYDDVMFLLDNLTSAQPEEFEWCHDCKEYDKTAHCCHRWTKVIRQTLNELKDAQPVRKTGRWIPCSERMPEDLEEVNVTWVNHIPEPYYDFLKNKPFTGSAVYYRGEWFWYSSTCVDILAEYGTNNMDKVDDGIEITAWMPLPEPYRGESE